MTIPEFLNQPVKKKDKKIQIAILSTALLIGLILLILFRNSYEAVEIFSKVVPEADLGHLHEQGEKIYSIGKQIGFYVVLIKCLLDLIKCGINGDTHGIGKIIMLYAMLYGSLFFLPWLLHLIEGIF